LQCLDELLFGEVVRADVALSCDEEDGTERVKLDALDDTFGFAERGLRYVAGELVDSNSPVLTCIC